MTQYPNLWQFFAGYLNPDWPDEYANEWAALDEYLRDDPDAAPMFCGEVRALLAEHRSEEAIRHLIFDDFKSAYLAEGWNYRDWLQALSDYVARAAGQPQAS